MSKAPLSWNDRFALIDHYQPSDDQICVSFNVTPTELSTARKLRDAGTFAPNARLNASEYPSVFDVDVSQVRRSLDITPKPGAIVVPPPSTTPTSTSHLRPETATKRTREPMKRGRKGNKIAHALMSIPQEPMSADEFSRKYDVSIAVLRQSKRFISNLPSEQQQAIGRVNVRQDKNTKMLMIWREVDNNE